jgi:hypothetical protein
LEAEGVLSLVLIDLLGIEFAISLNNIKRTPSLKLEVYQEGKIIKKFNREKIRKTTTFLC